MKLTDFRLEHREGRVRSSAAISWEDCDREEATIFFETDGPIARDSSITANAHAFLVACAAPAMFFGERRLYVDETVCPVLLEGLTEALTIIKSWFLPERTAPLALEAKAIHRDLIERSPRPAGCFFSGGIDAWTTLRLNMATFPEEHPYRIREGVVVFGLEQDDPERFELVRRYLARAAGAAGIGLTTVSTNAYLLYREEDLRERLRFWSNHFMGAALASVAHALAHRLAAVSISGSLSPRTLEPYGSHPIIDPRYGSSDVRIAHVGAALTRFEKTRLVADWGLPLAHLRVCNQYRSYQDGSFNCGRCGKCVMTRLALLALGEGAANDPTVFASHELSAALVEKRMRQFDAFSVDIEAFDEVVPPLRRRGHLELARGIERTARSVARRGRPAEAGSPGSQSRRGRIGHWFAR